MEPSKGQQAGPRISRATSLRLERPKANGQDANVGHKPDLNPKSIEDIPKTRDPSPTKLPVGCFRKGSSVRQASGAVSQVATTAHKRQSSASSVNLRGETLFTRPSQQPSLNTVKEASTVRDGESKSKPPTTRKVAPSVGPHTRNGSKGNSDIRRANDEKLKPKSTSGIVVPETKQRPGHTRTPSLGLAKVQAKASQRGASSDLGSQREGHSVHRHTLLDSSLELLQLHAIHSKSARTQCEWIESARKFYAGEFRKIVSFKEALNTREKDLFMQRNASALIQWGSRSGVDTLERRLQVLSTVLDDVWQLSSPTGRCTSIVMAFEHWYENAAESQECQSGTKRSAGTAVNATEGLGDGWKAEVLSLQEKMLEAANSILSLGEIESESDIARTIGLLLEQIKNMLEELELMHSIEQLMVLQQQFWVRRSIDELSRGI